MLETTELPAVPNYRILRVIGEGGMGVVYEAEQVAPVKRRVALKLLKVGMDTREFLGRFEAERQALAMMNDPGIAAIFEAGSTPEGRPFYAMEFVPGMPVTEFCDSNRLPVRARVELMIQICRALQHAYERRVIHRDLKPSNLLVAWNHDRPSAKVIDFGIAKAMTGRLTDRTFATEFGHTIGTPAYMSPEQWDATSGELDPRSDVYSLGLVFYEMLVGRLPFEPPSSVMDGVMVSVQRRDTQPPTPSQRLRTAVNEQGTIAKFRGTEPKKLMRDLRGDLDWIALRALEADRLRRYATASDFAGDLERYIRAEPIVARPPSAWYRARRFARRRRADRVAGAGSARRDGRLDGLHGTREQARRLHRGVEVGPQESRGGRGDVLRGQPHLHSGPEQAALQDIPGGDHHLLPGRAQSLDRHRGA